MLPAEVMGRVYEGILEEIKELQYHVYFHRVSLPLSRKLRSVFAAIRFSYGFS